MNTENKDLEKFWYATLCFIFGIICGLCISTAKATPEIKQHISSPSVYKQYYDGHMFYVFDNHTGDIEIVVAY